MIACKFCTERVFCSDECFEEESKFNYSFDECLYFVSRESPGSSPDSMQNLAERLRKTARKERVNLSRAWLINEGV